MKTDPRSKLTLALTRYIRAQHASEWSDTEIANGWNERNPQQQTHRRAVGEYRKWMGLKTNGPRTERYRRRVRAKTAEQLAAIGVTTLADLRAMRYREFARQRGWPEDLRPREVQILDLLYEQGPNTRRGIAEGIGWNMERGQRALLACKYGRGSYLANLMHRGLVVRMGRVVKGDGIGKNVYLYGVPANIKRGPHHNKNSKKGTDAPSKNTKSKE